MRRLVSFKVYGGDFTSTNGNIHTNSLDYLHSISFELKNADFLKQMRHLVSAYRVKPFEKHIFRYWMEIDAHWSLNIDT